MNSVEVSPNIHPHHVRRFEKVNDILAENGHKSYRLIPILQAVQGYYRYLPEDVLFHVANGLAVPPSRVFGVASFYSYFTLEPQGKHCIRLCDGTACHVKYSPSILEAVCKHLGLTGKQKTTTDLLFTIETVACLGGCALAPVIVIDDVIHGQMTPDSAVRLINEIIAMEASV